MYLKSVKELVTEHNGAEVSWDVSNFDKKCLGELYDVTKHINEYWARLPAHRQEKVYGIYTNIHLALETHADVHPLINAMLPLISELYAEHTLEEVSHWISFFSDIAVPAVFEKEYVHSEEKAGTREKTYIQSDYKQLLTLALCLRTMLPIWGEFIERTSRESGTLFKEFYAFQLISQTPLMNSPPMEKLRMYVGRNIQADKPMASSIMAGVGSQDYPAWLLGLVVVRRLCMGDLTITNPKTNLVTLVFNYVSNKVAGTNSGSFGGMVKNKEFESGNVASDMNVSRLEGYKLKQEAPIGDMVVLEHFLSDPLRVLLLLKPDANAALFQQLLQHAQALQSEMIWKPQIVLAQWVLKPVFPPRGIMHLSKQATVSALAIAQTVLWEKGHLELACLLTAVASNNQDAMSLGGTDSRAKITKVQMDLLGELYPYSRAFSTKKVTKPPNAAALAIDSMTTMLGQRDWVLTVPDEMAKQLTQKETQRRYSCPYAIKILLANLVIEIAQRR
jgi:hypothetical protein